MKLTTPLSVVVLATLAFGSTAHADWNRKGWVLLGEKAVNGRADHDTIRVGKREGKFTKLTLTVQKSELELQSFVVTFGNGETWDPSVKQFFKEGDRTRVIDLPGDDRTISKIDLTYRNLPRGGRAKLEVWAWKDASGGGNGRRGNRR